MCFFILSESICIQADSRLKASAEVDVNKSMNRETRLFTVLGRQSKTCPKSGNCTITPVILSRNPSSIGLLRHAGEMRGSFRAPKVNGESGLGHLHWLYLLFNAKPIFGDRLDALYRYILIIINVYIIL